MAKWARLMFWATFAQAIVGIVGIGFLWRNLVYTRRAVKAAIDAVIVTRQIGEIELRPYVHVSAADFHWDHLGPNIFVTCQNSGQTPATFFEIRFHTHAIAIGDDRSFKPPAESKPLLWPTLGAGASDSARLAGDQVDESADAVRAAPGAMAFYLNGTIRYGDTSGAEYESDFAFYTPKVRRTDTSGQEPRPIKLRRPTGELRAFVMIKEPDRAQTGARL